jgi:hypothetical protein
MRALLLVAVAGCWHEAAPPRAPAESPRVETPEVAYYSHAKPRLACDKVVAEAVERYAQNNPSIQTLKTVLLEVGTTSCQDDGWSEDTLICFQEAADEKGMTRCFDSLTEEQRDKFGARLRTGTGVPSTVNTPPP